MITYLNAAQATAVDVELMGTLGFSLDQLMELAGLSCAAAVAEAYPLETHPRVLVVAGPGNNGGDGLVAARHLTHFGYTVDVFYPKPTQRPIFQGLVTQLESLNLAFVELAAFSASDLDRSYDVIMDAVFGFSFEGDVRAPFDVILPKLQATCTPIASVDIPSGWSVDGEGQAPEAVQPSMLISLTAPKLCAQRLPVGVLHFLGGRFVPPAIRDKYNISHPPYPGTSQVVQLAHL